jgi:hypothetical protein
MIKNFDELLIVFDKANNAIKKNRIQIRKHLFNANFKEVAKVQQSQIVLKNRIQSYISAYKGRIKTNYLENKIFKGQLEYVENHVPSISLMKDIIYCVFELNKEYQKLRQDEINFALLGNFNYSEKKRLEKELFLR